MIVYAIRYKTWKWVYTKGEDYKEHFWKWYSGNGHGVLQCYATEGAADGIAKRSLKECSYKVVAITIPDVN